MNDIKSDIDTLVAERDAAIEGFKKTQAGIRALASACPRFASEFVDSRLDEDRTICEIAKRAVREVFTIASQKLTDGKVAASDMSLDDDGIYSEIESAARGAWPMEKRIAVWLSADLHAIADSLVEKYPPQAVADRLDHEAAKTLAGAFRLYSKWGRRDPKVTSSGVGFELEMYEDSIFAGRYSSGCIDGLHATLNALDRFAETGLDGAAGNEVKEATGMLRAKLHDRYHCVLMSGRSDLRPAMGVTFYKSKFVLRFSRPVGEALLLFIRVNCGIPEADTQAA